MSFRDRAMVSNNHSANVLSYELLLEESCHLDGDLFIQHDYQTIYLLRDAIHLIKKVRNNLLTYKRFIFPAFQYDGFEDLISFKGDQFSWKLFHDVFEKDSLLKPNLRKATKTTLKVPHPGNCKQNVPVVTTIFHESKSPALTSYFPEKKNEPEFLKPLIHGGLFPSPKFSFQTTFWAMRQKKMTGSHNFVVSKLD